MRGVLSEKAYAAMRANQLQMQELSAEASRLQSRYEALVSNQVAIISRHQLEAGEDWLAININVMSGEYFSGEEPESLRTAPVAGGTN